MDPFSKLSQEIALERLFVQQAITFEEYVDTLNDDSSVPKGKLKAILDDRMSQIPPEVLEALQQSPELVNAVMQIVGGGGGGARCYAPNAAVSCL